MPLENDSRAGIVRIGITSSGDMAKVANDPIQPVSPIINTKVSSIATSETVAVDNLELSESVTVDNLAFRVKTSVHKAITTSSGQSSGEHAALHGLDYEHSGHTGFASTVDLNTQVLVNELESLIPQEQLAILKKNATVQLLYHDKLYSLSVRAGRNWTYTYIEKSTGNIDTITVDVDSGAFDISSNNPVQTNLNTHINDTSVHLQTGERIAWNNKVSATVEEAEEKLIFF